MLPFYGSSGEEEQSLKRVFRIGKVIGQGAYAKVRKMTRKSDGLHFALKTVNKDKIPPELKQVHNAWMYEARLLLEMDHPHIVKMETVFETPKKIMMVMEYLSTDLHEALEKRSESGQIATADACTIIYRLADALKYLHAQGVVHRDLKPENILVSGRDPTDIKLADFGTAGRIGPGREQLHTNCGSLSYVAPEVLKQQPYGCEVDIWSLGVIIYRMLSDSLPFSDPNTAVKLRKVIIGKYSFPSDKWDRIDPDGTGPIDLIKRCLEVDPAVRITASEILKHPWVSQHYKPLQRLPPSPTTDVPATPWLQSASPIRQLRDPQLLPQIPEIILDGGSGDTTPSFTTPSHNVRNLLALDPAAASAQAYPSVLSLLLASDKTLVIDKIVLVRDQLLATSDSDETEQDQKLRQLSYSVLSLSHQCRSAPSRTRSLLIDPSISIEREEDDDADDDEEDEDEKEEEKETSETKEDCSDSESRSRTSKMHERRTSKMHTRLDSPPRVVCKRASSEPGPDGPDHFSTPWSRDELDIRLKNNDRLVAGHATLHCVTPAAPSSPAASSRVMSERVSLCIPKDGVQHHKALSPARSFKNVTQKQRRHSIQPISFSQLSPTLSLSKLNLLQPSPRTSSNSLSQPLRTFAFGKPNKTQPSRGRPISYSPFSDSTRSIVPMPPSPLSSLSRAVAAPLSHPPTSSLRRRSIGPISHSPFAVSPRSLEPSSHSPVSSHSLSLSDSRRSIVPMPPSPLPSLSRAVAAPLSHSPTSSLPRRSIDLISHSPFAVSPRSLEPSSQSPVSSTPRSLGFNGVSHSHSLPSATRRILEPPVPLPSTSKHSPLSNSRHIQNSRPRQKSLEASTPVTSTRSDNATSHSPMSSKTLLRNVKQLLPLSLPQRPSRQGSESVPSHEIVEKGRKEVESQLHQNKRKVYSPMRESQPKPATKRQETPTRGVAKGYARERSSGIVRQHLRSPPALRRSSLSPFPMPVKNPNAPPKDMFWV
eukprot:g31574.t1